MSGGTGFGIGPQGFVMPQLTDIQTEINQSLVNTFGAAINLNPESFFGQISGIFSERELLVWQAMQDVYDSQTPDEAFGASLDNVGALRGNPRLQATFSTLSGFLLFGSNGTIVPSGTQFSVAGQPSNLFSLNNAVTLITGASCVQTLTFSAVPVSGTWTITINGSSTGLLPFNATAAQVQTAIQALNFCSGCTVTGSYTTAFTVTFNGPGTGGFMVQPEFGTTSTMITSAPAPVTVVPAIITPGVDQGVGVVTATVTGPVVANAGTLTTIATPIAGLTNSLNITDAVLGTNVETDNAYRLRMDQELQAAGAGTLEAIRSKVLEVAGVRSVLVYENTTDTTDMMGLPPHSFEVFVAGGAAADIAEAIWLAKPAGIASFGTSSFVITDSQGQPHTIFYSVPTAVDIYIIANITFNASYPVDGDALVKESLANYINSLGEGVSVIVTPQLIAQLAPIPGIDDVVLLVGTAPGPTMSDNIPIAAFEVAFTQTSFITVNDTPG